MEESVLEKKGGETGKKNLSEDINNQIQHLDDLFNDNYHLNDKGWV